MQSQRRSSSCVSAAHPFFHFDTFLLFFWFHKFQFKINLKFNSNTLTSRTLCRAALTYMEHRTRISDVPQNKQGSEHKNRKVISILSFWLCRQQLKLAEGFLRAWKFRPPELKHKVNYASLFTFYDLDERKTIFQNRVLAFFFGKSRLRKSSRSLERRVMMKNKISIRFSFRWKTNLSTCARKKWKRKSRFLANPKIPIKIAISILIIIFISRESESLAYAVPRRMKIKINRRFRTS